jgi:pimeloyl-ACP methyl ester carboxylesterase
MPMATNLDSTKTRRSTPARKSVVQNKAAMPRETASPSEASVPKAPSALLMMLEARAPWEFASTLAAWPLLQTTPRGDGHPVLVLPGLAANDLSTVMLRNFLSSRGYLACPWNYGFNFGPRYGVLAGCVEHVRELSERHGQKVSLVGWSLGGIYAREIAKALPDQVRGVITLGTPFDGPPRATNAWRLYELVSGQKVEDHELREQIRSAPPVPTTSIYSRSDGVVAWQCSINRDRGENIEVLASHTGMGMNPLAFYVIADRLAQELDAWKPFEVTGPLRHLIKVRQAEGV